MAWQVQPRGFTPMARLPSAITVHRLLSVILLASGCLGEDPSVGETSRESDVTCPTPADAEGKLPTALAKVAPVLAGSVEGSFRVSKDGGATFQISLVVPPGRAGMEPRLAAEKLGYKVLEWPGAHAEPSALSHLVEPGGALEGYTLRAIYATNKFCEKNCKPLIEGIGGVLTDARSAVFPW